MFPVSGMNKIEVVNRVIEWEKKGYEVLCPIQTIISQCNDFRFIDNSAKSQNFLGPDINIIYYTKMRKVG